MLKVNGKVVIRYERVHFQASAALASIGSYIMDTIFSGPGDWGPGTRGPGTRGTRTQGPKLACTVHVASSLGEYPGPRAFCAWVCVSNRMEWDIEFF